MYITVKYDHRDTVFIHFLYDRSDCVGLVWSSNDDVKTVLLEIADIGDLFLIAVIGRADLDRDPRGKHDLTVDLVVHFHSPVILAALGDSDTVGLRVTTATAGEDQGDDERKNPI